MVGTRPKTVESRCATNMPLAMARGVLADSKLFSMGVRRDCMHTCRLKESAGP
jgi:hypothetical protein